MSATKSRLKETQTFSEDIIISSTAHTQSTPTKICWNTGEEKNCPACYLSKGCKAKA